MQFIRLGQDHWTRLLPCTCSPGMGQSGDAGTVFGEGGEVVILVHFGAPAIWGEILKRKSLVSYFPTRL